MAIFKLCSEISCDLAAEIGCSCDLLFCRYHIGDHLVSHKGHASTPILLTLSEEETSTLHRTYKSQFLSMFQQEIADRNKEIERLLNEIKEVERVYSERIETLLRSQEEISAVFNEIEEKGSIPLVSDNLSLIHI